MIRYLLWLAARRAAGSETAQRAARGSVETARRVLPQLARKAGEASRVVAPPGGAEELGRNLGRVVGRTWRRINRPDP
ncbi:MAG: hypothetical protein H6843_05195 [Rhodospirillaceae bacterium]|nr:hypothetical protein [Rhodospirillaceae bacterium]